MEPVNIKWIARELNLAVSTVSKALRDSHEISAATKQRVLAFAAAHEYIPNPYASSLRRRKSKTIGVVVPEINDSFFALAINGIESVAIGKGYHVLIYLSHESLVREEAILKDFQSGRVDGVLMSVSSETKETGHLKALRGKGIPIVFFDRAPDETTACRVITNDLESGCQAAAHLIERGCKRPAFLAFSSNLSISNQRLAGFQQAMAANHIKNNKHTLIECGSDSNINYHILKKILLSKQRPDGFVASVEKLTTVLYQVCAELEILIPQEIKVVGFSNQDTASILYPPLTTITQPAFEIGAQATKLLLNALEKPKHHLPQELVVIPSVLIPRKSTAAE